MRAVDLDRDAPEPDGSSWSGGQRGGQLVARRTARARRWSRAGSGRAAARPRRRQQRAGRDPRQRRVELPAGRGPGGSGRRRLATAPRPAPPETAPSPEIVTCEVPSGMGMASLKCVSWSASTSPLPFRQTDAGGGLAGHPHLRAGVRQPPDLGLPGRQARAAVAPGVLGALQPRARAAAEQRLEGQHASARAGASVRAREAQVAVVRGLRRRAALEARAGGGGGHPRHRRSHRWSAWPAGSAPRAAPRRRPRARAAAAPPAARRSVRAPRATAAAARRCRRAAARTGSRAAA